jgi:hypothetical protein
MSRGGAFRLFGGWVRSHFEPLPISGDLGSLSGVGEGGRARGQVGLRAPVAVGARPRAAGRPLPSSSQLSSAHGSGMDFEVHSYLRAGSVPTPGGGVQLVGSWCTGPARAVRLRRCAATRPRGAAGRALSSPDRPPLIRRAPFPLALAARRGPADERADDVISADVAPRADAGPRGAEKVVLLCGCGASVLEVEGIY